MTNEQKNFIEKVGNIAAAAMERSGILASLVTAQAILESGWGKSGLTVKANALFGIKAGAAWKGRVYSAVTKECYDGASFTTVTALFRAYGSWEESIADHTALLTGLSRYGAVIGERDYKMACVAVQKAGYATDPFYASKLIQLIETYSLTRYDTADKKTALIHVCLDGTIHETEAEAIGGHWFITLGLGGLKIRLADLLPLAGYTFLRWEPHTKTIIARSEPCV